MQDIMGLRDTVYTLVANVQHLTEQVLSLTSNPRSDPEGEYNGDTGPAVRAQFFQRSIDADRMRMDELEGRIASLKIAIGDIQGTQGEYQGAGDTLVSDVNRLEESR